MKSLIGFSALCVLLIAVFIWYSDALRFPAAPASVASEAAAQPIPATQHSTAIEPAPVRAATSEAPVPIRAATSEAPVPIRAATVRERWPGDARATEKPLPDGRGSDRTLPHGRGSDRTPPPQREAPTHWASDSSQQEHIATLRRARAELKHDPYNETALNDALSAAAALGNAKVSNELLAHRASIHPEDTAAQFDYAASSLALRRWHDAVAPLRLVVARQPDFAQAWFDLALAEQQLRRLDDALRSWNRAVALLPDSGEAWANRGEVLLDLREYSATVESLRRALRLEPSIAVRHNLALALWKLGRTDEAFGELRQVLADHPRHIATLNRLGEWSLIRYQQNPVGARAALDDAVKYWRHSLKLDAGQTDVKAQLAAAVRKQAG